VVERTAVSVETTAVFVTMVLERMGCLKWWGWLWFGRVGWRAWFVWIAEVFMTWGGRGGDGEGCFYWAWEVLGGVGRIILPTKATGFWMRGLGAVPTAPSNLPAWGGKSQVRVQHGKDVVLANAWSQRDPRRNKWSIQGASL
jgi:hypothetical protein